jgi:hypothetical protein
VRHFLMALVASSAKCMQGFVCMYARPHVCMYPMHVCMPACLHVCLYDIHSNAFVLHHKQRVTFKAFPYNLYDPCRSSLEPLVYAFVGIQRLNPEKERHMSQRRGASKQHGSLAISLPLRHCGIAALHPYVLAAPHGCLRV